MPNPEGSPIPETPDTFRYLFEQGKSLAEAGISTSDASVGVFDLPFASDTSRAALVVRHTPGPFEEIPGRVRLAIIKENLIAEGDPDIIYSHLLVNQDGQVLDCAVERVENATVDEWLQKQLLDRLTLRAQDMPRDEREATLQEMRNELIQPTAKFGTSFETNLRLVDPHLDNITSDYDTRERR